MCLSMFNCGWEHFNSLSIIEWQSNAFSLPSCTWTFLFWKSIFLSFYLVLYTVQIWSRSESIQRLFNIITFNWQLFWDMNLGPLVCYLPVDNWLICRHARIVHEFQEEYIKLCFIVTLHFVLFSAKLYKILVIVDTTAAPVLYIVSQ